MAAQNRFIYYPDHLVRMPGPGQDLFAMAWSILTEPAFKGLIPGMLFEQSRPKRPESLQDESIASFLTRRNGNPAIAENIASAVFHGIYAGDIHKLSAKSLITKVWDYEGQYGSIVKGLVGTARKGELYSSPRDSQLHREMTERLSKTVLLERMQLTSVYTFKSGLEGFSDAVAASFIDNPNVTLKVGADVESLELDQNPEIKHDELKVCYNIP